MKTATLLTAILTLALLQACGEAPAADRADDVRNPVELTLTPLATGTGPVTSVGTIETERYLGTWYEIASIPQWFQSFCGAGVRARYALRTDGLIEVTNSCIDRSGNYRELNGIAGPSNPARNAELQVSFVGERPDEFGGDYWILFIDEAYRLAVVGEPSRKYGWILSRQPGLSQERLDLALAVFANAGYDTSLFVLADQSPYLP
ncbi:MAG: hypothetical protein D6761_08920 [Candidatus Dadabacteria bacterium]|nr:MAG: hypothetical protein D6761_08920 [Candidatus Dadabacteria bacterium]